MRPRYEPTAVTTARLTKVPQGGILFAKVEVQVNQRTK